MTKWFVSRHAGAIVWAQEQDVSVDHYVTHLDIGLIRAGDVVMGNLPVDLAAQVCAQGAQYWHLSVPVSENSRGRELSAEEIRTLGAKLQPFHVAAIAT